MTIKSTIGLLVLAAAQILASNTWAQTGSTPAPELAAKPIPPPIAGVSGSGLLDIDFRCDIPALPDPAASTYDEALAARSHYLGTYPYCSFYEPRKIIKVSATGGELIQNGFCPDNVSDQTEPSAVFQDGYGIVGTRSRSCDDGIGKGESLIVSIESSIDNQTAAFDVNGVWLTDFRRDKNGESGVITLTLAGGGSRTFSFNWKDVSSGNIDLPNINDEFFVGFGQTLRITKAVISGNSGSFSVAGFSQQPVVIDTRSSDLCGGNSCNPEIARGVRLELKKVSAENIAGNKGVKGTLFKEGVYVIPDTRKYCKPGLAATPEDPARPLPISITGRTDPDTGAPIPDVIMQPYQCGHPTADSPNDPVIYVLDLDGRNLVIAEDTIAAKFDDGKDDPGIPAEYVCTASYTDREYRPGIGWLPKTQKNAEGKFDEIPVLNAAGEVVLHLQEVTGAPCGSSRGSVPRYSYVVYNWTNRVDAAHTSDQDVISARIAQLGAYVDGLFACVQQGVNQSTFSSDVGRISKSFASGQYDRALRYVREMRNDVLDPRLNSEIGENSGCVFDLRANGGYGITSTPGGDPLPDYEVHANAVGNLLVQLEHLHWMISTTVLNQPPGSVQALGN